MKNGEIIRMAREAGVYGPFMGEDEDLERFAQLVAAAEREACAKVCIGLEIPNGIEGLHPDSEEGMLFAVMQCSAAIRARGNE